ncbi:hypothetical protein RF11_12946 [Thelohanellus kitauei]|uniref:Uncharacterized protein n=1 Tax=Thelohanellus kitauei TaxID=669202 RepID=A0A0C2J5G8_THEKT|nr:hypothetical protein RF11_12946 [Thelohanellus kitauei]
MKNYQLQFILWRGTPNIFLLNFQNTKKDKNPKHQILHISNDEGKLFFEWKQKYNGKRIYINKFVAIQNYLFCESSLTRKFFYFDKQLNLFVVNTYESMESIFPSSFNPSYIYKLVTNDETVNLKHI